jgi:hypothetical protein
MDVGFLTHQTQHANLKTQRTNLKMQRAFGQTATRIWANSNVHLHAFVLVHEIKEKYLFYPQFITT